MSWKARLKGDSFDLDTLTDLFSEGDPTIAADEEGYFLQSSTLDGLTEATAVKERADELLDNVNGVARVLDPSYRNVELDGKFDSDSGRSVVIEIGTATARARVGAVVVQTGETNTSHPAPRGPRYVALAAVDADVAEALGYLAASVDPATLFKVYEIIEHDVGSWREIREAGWASRNEIARFKASVNRPEVSGTDARHARYAGTPPGDPMNQAEARRFLIDLLHRWMDSKLQWE